MITNNLVKFLLIVIVIVTLTYCSGKTVIANEFVMGSPRTQSSGKIIKDSLLHGHNFIRLDSTTMFGPRYTYYLQEGDKGKAFKLTITGKVRNNYVQSNGTIIYFLTDSTTQYNWDGSNLKYHVVDLNSWWPFKEEVTFQKNSPGFNFTKINIQSFLPSAREEKFDLDSLKIKLERIE